MGEFNFQISQKMKIEIPTIPLISICTGSGLNQKYTDCPNKVTWSWQCLPCKQTLCARHPTPTLSVFLLHHNHGTKIFLIQIVFKVFLKDTM